MKLWQDCQQIDLIPAVWQGGGKDQEGEYVDFTELPPSQPEGNRTPVHQVVAANCSCDLIIGIRSKITGVRLDSNSHRDRLCRRPQQTLDFLAYFQCLIRGPEFCLASL